MRSVNELGGDSNQGRWGIESHNYSDLVKHNFPMITFKKFNSMILGRSGV